MKITKPLFFVFLMNILGFGLLIYQHYDGQIDRVTTIFGSILLLLILVTFVIIHTMRMGDPYLFLIAACLLTIGVLMLFRIDPASGRKQMVWIVAAVAAFFVTYGVMKKFSFSQKQIWLYLGGALLLFVLTFALGSTIKGSKNWIDFKIFSIQPSELIKILYVFTLASLFYMPLRETQQTDRLPVRFFHNKFGRQLCIMAVAYVHLGLLVLQREWGIGLLFFLIYFSMLYVCGNDFKVMAFNVIAVCGAGLVGYKLLYHIQTRVQMWLDPFSDPTGKGFQIVQSLFAINAGGFTGTGIGYGSPEFIPEVHSDFIFAAICEEMGVLGGMAVIMLYFILVYRGFKITLSVTNTFNKLVALGITIMFAFQTFIIIGGVIKFIPLTGITLPFISYGGSSMVTSFMALGILQAISAKKEEITDAI